jgi:hypothetical protein
MILDKVSIHGTPKARAWLTLQGGRVHFEFLPLHASWLNQIELLVQYPRTASADRAGDATYTDCAGLRIERS